MLARCAHAPLPLPSCPGHGRVTALHVRCRAARRANPRVFARLKKRGGSDGARLPSQFSHFAGTMALFRAVKCGALALPNAIVMAPLTRCRAGAGFVPEARSAAYYAERASAGLIISEATCITAGARGCPHTPGIYTSQQEAGWRGVTDAVHARGGRIVLQLWHQGRTAFEPVAPSAVPLTPGGVPPHVLSTTEIAELVRAYGAAAAAALRAGFDGVEVHGANGYLPDQFLQTGTNLRDDVYGGSIENRARFLLEVTDACIAAAGADRVGVRISPASHFNAVSTVAPQALFGHVARALANRRIAYLHIVEPRVAGNVDAEPEAGTVEAAMTAASFKEASGGGFIIAAGGYTAASAEAAVAAGAVDAVAFGRHFISNPDLVERLRLGAPLTPYNRATFYSQGDEGYLGYPSLTAAEAKRATVH